MESASPISSGILEMKNIDLWSPNVRTFPSHGHKLDRLDKYSYCAMGNAHHLMFIENDTVYHTDEFSYRYIVYPCLPWCLDSHRMGWPYTMCFLSCCIGWSSGQAAFAAALFGSRQQHFCPGPRYVSTTGTVGSDGGFGVIYDFW